MSLSGNVILFAGTLLTSPASFAAQAEASGAAVSTFLVAGPGAEDEVATATAAGVTVISEAEFSRLFFGGGVGAAAEDAGAEALGGDFATVTARGFVRVTPIVPLSPGCDFSYYHLVVTPPPPPPLLQKQVHATRAAQFEAEVEWDGVAIGAEKTGEKAVAHSAFPGGLGTAGPVPAPHSSRRANRRLFTLSLFFLSALFFASPRFRH